MYLIRPFTVVPSLPQPLQFLEELAHNLWWTWHTEGIDLFRRLDRDYWERCGHNPVLMLGQLPQSRLEQAASDEGFLAQMERVKAMLDEHLVRKSWFDKNFSHLKDVTIAYFSAEFGLTESLPIYSGGLGVLAGDHIKSASELGVPLVGVGLLYRLGYFHQYLNADGWQQETYPGNDFYTMPVRLVTDAQGRPTVVEVEYPGRLVKAQIWKIQVGRIPVYLLDTNIDDNLAEDRQITAQLYGGDSENRIRQEVLLGVGGIRALAAVGIEPTICHMNEGHSAFLALERVRRLVAHTRMDYVSAREATRASQIFTTHTPVPAGIDRFPPAMIEKYLKVFYDQFGITSNEFMALGRQSPADPQETLSMAVLALRTAAASNGVSKLHGRVSRTMWQNVWPDVPEDEIPIGHVTNGVHTRSWISGDMATLLDRYLGPRWARRPEDHSVWQRIEQIPDEELWRTHERRRERLVSFARVRLAAHLRARGAPTHEIVTAGEVLSAEILTIGFARRFATYKRAMLLFHDFERLKRILTDRKSPVQIIFAGKAHPRDNEGKELIRRIVHMARGDELVRRRIVFLEDYDMNVARYMVQGCDIWLNTPRRPLEASGTSGMKAAANGALNVSVLDGWWDEAFKRDLGWAIGDGEVYDDLNYQDQVESAALYNLLEKEIVPLFYDRGADNLPRGWIACMKESMRLLGPRFSATRMVMDYVERFYLPAAHRAHRLASDNLARARALAAWKQRVAAQWRQVRIATIEAASNGQLRVGQALDVAAEVNLGELVPQDVSVQLYTGALDTVGQLRASEVIAMQVQGEPKDGKYRFVGQIPCQASGRRGFAIRVLPHHEDLANPHELGLILWAR